MRPRFDLADVISCFGSELVAKTKLTPLQLKVLGKIAQCRTASLGGHEQACKTPWVMHCEPSLASAEHVVKYLGQYTHRVAITNQRILNISGAKVIFIAKDYRDGAAKKPISIDGVEFLRRFTMHNLSRESGFCPGAL